MGNYPASEFDMPTFRNTRFYLHGQAGTYLPVHEDGTECSETSAYKLRRRKHTTSEFIIRALSFYLVMVRVPAIPFIARQISYKNI